MRVVTQLTNVPTTCPLALAIGVFDGVHRGHQAVLRAVRDRAAAVGGEAWVLTFDPHPAAVVRPKSAPPALLSTSGKVRRLAEVGMDGVVLQPFTPEFAAMPPLEFLEWLRRVLPNLRAIGVGSGWRFGRGGTGDVECLRTFAHAHGVEAIVVPPLSWRGEPISSTRIRLAVQIGRMEEAAAMLGYWYRVDGPVRTGQRIGHQLGFATANLAVAPGHVRPPYGVYAGWARWELSDPSAWHAAAIYIGTRPTFGPDGEPALEAHLLDSNVELYGQTLEVALAHFVRPDHAFASLEELRDQIALDVEQVRVRVAELSVDKLPEIE